MKTSCPPNGRRRRSGRAPTPSPRASIPWTRSTWAPAFSGKPDMARRVPVGVFMAYRSRHAYAIPARRRAGSTRQLAQPFKSMNATVYPFFTGFNDVGPPERGGGHDDFSTAESHNTSVGSKGSSVFGGSATFGGSFGDLIHGVLGIAGRAVP